MTIIHESGGVTRLEGGLRDQAALYGLINRIRDLWLHLLTVRELGPEGDDVPRPRPRLEAPGIASGTPEAIRSPSLEFLAILAPMAPGRNAALTRPTGEPP